MEAEARAGALARAKVNLTLHLRGQRADGYHLLDSLVVFPEIGDWVRVERAEGLSLSVTGPFAGQISDGSDNLVLKAAEALAASRPGRPGASLSLEKNLPIASGIGGGSSDAAATLALLSDLWDCPVPPDLAMALGADVPVCCRAPVPQRMLGIGEQLTPAAPMPCFWIVLANPKVAVSTGAVFAGVPDKNPARPAEAPAKGFATFDDLVTWLAAQRNDLQDAATTLCPPIDPVLKALSAAPFTRMSGSGATCFALVENQEQAVSLADRLHAETDWWIATALVQG